MNAIDVCVIVLSLGALFEFLLGLVVRSYRFKLEHRVRIEQARGEFAGARVALTKLALAGKLDSRGDEFRKLNQSFTFVMRRPEQYLEIGRLFNSTITESLKKVKLNSGITANIEMLPVYKQMLAGTALLLVDQSFVSRYFLTWAEREKLRAEPHKFFIGMKRTIDFLCKLEARYKPELAPLYEVKGDLERAMAIC
jgi:hypothetical protein